MNRSAVRAYFTRDMVAGTATIALGGVFLAASFSIRGFGDDPVGPKFLPQTACLLMILFGSGIVIREWRRRRLAGRELSQAGFELGNAGRLATLALASLLYPVLFHSVGYVVASLLVFPAILHVFGARSIGRIALATAGSVAAFYALFFKLLGVHLPPASWFDLASLIR